MPPVAKYVKRRQDAVRATLGKQFEVLGAFHTIPPYGGSDVQDRPMMNTAGCGFCFKVGEYEKFSSLKCEKLYLSVSESLLLLERVPKGRLVMATTSPDSTLATDVTRGLSTGDSAKTGTKKTIKSSKWRGVFITIQSLRHSLSGKLARDT
ncbi:hypothetical protein CPB83DRAFT_839385 [Crepidotus variabilis]|uniref:Uncharacterized protein n=1 Tax=Crepidotus variabilis TaxID=179855 RepID=A0A9P6E7C2_9AGAR|nr:hypothetical protein CPB83DRAFT_839385 [Crepidotus variabilis]